MIEDAKFTHEEMRREFDAAFAKPALADAMADVVELLIVRAGTARLALRTSQILGVRRCPTIARIPSAAKALVGVAAIRGVVVGVYSLARLTGQPVEATAADWLALCGDGTVGLGFEEMGALARVAATQVHPARDGDGSHQSVAEVGGVPHVVVDIQALLKTVTGIQAKPGE